MQLTALRSSLILGFLVTQVVAKLVFSGNDVIRRDQYTATGAKRTWLDTSSSLPAGYLVKYFVYVNDVVNADQYSTRLQVWRPAAGSLMYSLVWERSVRFWEGGGRVYELSIPFEESILLSNGDHIGWTNDNLTSPISFDYSTGGKIRQLFISADQVPQLGQTYSFTNIVFPAVFSIGVLVSELACGGTMFGNILEKGSSYNENADHVTVIDTISQLPAGYMTSFSVYTHPVPPGDYSVNFQIWRPTSDISTFLLVWEKQVTFDKGTGRLYEELFPEDDSPTVSLGDYMGITYDGDTGVVSYKFDTEGKTIVRTGANTGTDVGNNYTFDPLSQPLKYAMAVRISDQPCQANYTEEASGWVLTTWLPPQKTPPTARRPTRVTYITTEGTSTTTTSANGSVTTGIVQKKHKVPGWLPYTITALVIVIALIVVGFVLMYLKCLRKRSSQFNYVLHWVNKYSKSRSRQPHPHIHRTRPKKRPGIKTTGETNTTCPSSIDIEVTEPT